MHFLCKLIANLYFNMVNMIICSYYHTFDVCVTRRQVCLFYRLLYLQHLDIQVCFVEIKIVFSQPKIIWNKIIFSRIQDSLQSSTKIKLPYATYLILIKESRYELFSKINRQMFVKTDVSKSKIFSFRKVHPYGARPWAFNDAMELW